MAYSSLLPHHLAPAFSTYSSPILLPFSSSRTSTSTYGSHTAAAYSNTGRTIVPYAFSFTSQLTPFSTLPSIPRALLPFATTLSTCFFPPEDPARFPVVPLHNLPIPRYCLPHFHPLALPPEEVPYQSHCPLDRGAFVGRSSQSVTRPVSKTSLSQSGNGYAHIESPATPFLLYVVTQNFSNLRAASSVIIPGIFLRLLRVSASSAEGKRRDCDASKSRRCQLFTGLPEVWQEAAGRIEVGHPSQRRTPFRGQLQRITKLLKPGGGVAFSPRIPALLHVHHTSPASALEISMLGAAQISPLHLNFKSLWRDRANKYTEAVPLMRACPLAVRGRNSRDKPRRLRGGRFVTSAPPLNWIGRRSASVSRLFSTALGVEGGCENFAINSLANKATADTRGGDRYAEIGLGEGGKIQKGEIPSLHPSPLSIRKLEQRTRPEKFASSMPWRLDATVLCTNMPISTAHIGCLLSQWKATIGHRSPGGAKHRVDQWLKLYKRMHFGF
ncbi:hypothetical protein PR048_029566 [Dryococelus australis]|uniref:Uncharacterized protein n=1 Tax=Dryococelus australis TaxID=614101 RepID=A0ABQ9GE25_9NEOP|nr:hypothetical protein PR048_029566 [Dryococelus australis]